MLRDNDSSTMAMTTTAVAPLEIQRANLLENNLPSMVEVRVLKEARVAAAARHICTQTTLDCVCSACCGSAIMSKSKTKHNSNSNNNDDNSSEMKLLPV